MTISKLGYKTKGEEKYILQKSELVKLLHNYREHKMFALEVDCLFITCFSNKKNGLSLKKKSKIK